LGGAVVISFIFMYTLKCLAGVIVWTSTLGIILVFAAAGFIFLYNAGVISSSYLSTYSIPSVEGVTQSEYEIYGYIAISLGAVFLVLFLCCFSRIRLAVAVCKAAGQFVSHTCSIVLVPIFQTVITIGTWAICILAMLYIISTASFTSSSDVFTSLTSYTDSSLYQFYAFLFGTLWCNAFLQAVGTFVIASACCLWYYSHGPDQ
jgi:hypothetical protein